MPEQDEEDERAIRSVMVGVDGSDTSLSALTWACELASAMGAPVVAVTSWQWPTGLGPAMAFPTGYDPAGDARTMLEGIVAEATHRFPTVTLEARIVEGHAAEVLVEASRHADLLVVGSRGHGAFTGMLLGSVSQHCATHSLSPVVIYRDRSRPPGPA